MTKSLWWGKAAGGTIGFVVGGPLGALIGVLLGHQVDEGLTRELARGDAEAASAGTRLQLEFFTTTFSVMGRIAKADGRVSEDEIAAARGVMRHMKLAPDQIRAAIKLFEQGKRADFPMASILQSFRISCEGRRDILHTFIEIQLQAALADGRLHPETRRVLWQVCSELDISRLEFAQLEAIARAHGHADPGRVAPADGLGHAYGVLGIERGATDDDVKLAYRRLISQHHPDKLVSRGLPQEMLDLARDKAREINAAYDLIKDARGMH